MKQISKFEPSNLDSIRKDMNAALAKIEAEYGIKFNIGRISYNSNEFSTKITTVVNSTNPQEASNSTLVVNAKWKADFLKHGWKHNFEKEDFGSIVQVAGKDYYIVGAKPIKPNLILQKVGTKECYDIPAARVTRVAK